MPPSMQIERGERMGQIQLATLAAEAREAIDGEEYDRAAHACRRALSRFPRWVDGYWMLGTILVERDYPQEAQACFEAVASATPDDPRPYEGLAAVAEHLGELPVAAAGLFRAIEVGEPSAAVRHELQRLLEQLRRPTDIVTTHARLAHAHLQSGQYEAADLAAEKALEEEPERLDMLLVQAVARLLGNDKRSALGRCEALLEASPDCLKALAMTRILVADTDKARAAQIDEDLAALDPEQHVLVWLHQQIAGRGFDVGTLPSAPRTVSWLEDDAVAEAPAAQPGSLLERLIPDLERAMPQWLRDIGTEQHPEPAPANTAPATASTTSEGRAAAAGADETPSFLGDVDALAQEFQEAMKASAASPAVPEADIAPSPPAPAPSEAAPATEWTTAPAREASAAPTTNEAAQATARETLAAAWDLPEARPSSGTPPAAEAAEPPVPTLHDDANAVAAEADPAPALVEPAPAVPSPSTADEVPPAPEPAPSVAATEEQVAPAFVNAEPVAPSEATAWRERHEEWGVPPAVAEERQVIQDEPAPAQAPELGATASEARATQDVGAPVTSQPAYDPRDAEQARRAGDTAARAGNYWQAIRAYGDALAALRR